MKVTFLSQGFLADTDMAVGTLIEKFFSGNEYHTFTGITAFASEAGIYGLSNCIADSLSIKSINLIVGIDQEGTPKDALEELLKLNVNSYIFYQKEAPIFHPKIYLFEGDAKTSIIVGSSNLTGRGLFNNIESSTLIEFDNDDTEGLAYLKAMKDYYSTLFDFSDPNLFKITSDIIQKFVDSKVVPTKRVWLNKQGKKRVESNTGDTFDIPDRKVGTLPLSFRRKPKAKEMAETSQEEIFAVNESEANNSTVVTVISSQWSFNDTSEVLIVEIGVPKRWKQISFAKANFKTFFMLPTTSGQSGQINLKYLETNGNLQTDVEVATSVCKGSSNYTIEPAVVRASTVPYNSVNRPIIFFIKIDATHFIYHFETNGTPLYNQLNIPLGVKNGKSLRRQVTTVASLRAACPALTI